MRLEVKDSAAASIDRGHPWVYRDALKKTPARLDAGAVVDLADGRGRFLGRGLWDPSSPIAVRVHERDAKTPLDVSSFARRIDAAFALRARLFDAGDTDAYRAVNGEGDRVPGLVIDRYRDVAVLRLDGDALTPWIEALRDPIRQIAAAHGIRSGGVRIARDARTGGGKLVEQLWGPPIPERTMIRERGLALEVDLHFGHKTGAFLDQRENLARVRQLGRGRSRALNLFSYTGGFSIAAALGGAERVTSVDTAGPAHASAQRSFRENGLDPTKHAFVTADAFAFLEAAEKRGERFDLVISDPPSFAPSEKTKPRAMTSYRRLHQACARVLAPGGIFCAASCSSHITSDDFFATLDDASLGRDDLRVVSMLGQPEDHPFLPAWPEGRYLKFATLM
ncbi:MAG: class I SAM-dependent rRNA methyltransferase [Polyangiaceae bacterium]